jgi:hypothetical protein|tara:strand:- start:2998 stop:3324 length:327 start_codon:yes stop_codon:yes gene_type:complete
MQIEGKLIKILEAESGTSKNGKAWIKQSCIVQTDSEYNNQVCISAFGEDKVENLNKLKEGQDVQIWCNVYSREYNGKYYNQIDGWRFSKSGSDFKPQDMITSDNDMPF